MTQTYRATSLGLLAALLSFGVAQTALAADIHTKPPANFKKVSTLVKLPDFIPGLGTLYVDPSTLPAGPFLGYDKKGKLVEVTYMLPLKDLDAHKNWEDLGAKLGHLRIDHTDFTYNPGHPGVEEPHYHITEWLIGKKQQDELK